MSNALWLLWGLGSLILFVLFIMLSAANFNNDISRIVFLCLGVGFFLSMSAFMVAISERNSKPENKYERLLNDLDRAEKNLQKFYIDHPEFKEEQE